MRRPRRLVHAAILLGSACVAAVGVAGAAAGAPAVTASPGDAASYLVANLTDGDHYEGEFGPEYGATADVALGLVAAGGREQAVDEVVGFMIEPDSVAAYVHGVPFDAPDAVYAGAVSKLGFLASITGGDPREVAGEDLITTLEGIEQADGRFTDVSDFGDFSNVLTQSYAILSLTAAEGVEPSEAAVQRLVDAQCDNGSFGLSLGGGACEGTPDATGIAVQALNANDPGESEALTAEREAALVAAVRWLEDARQPDGSYALDGEVNINTTGYGGLGLYAAGLDAESTTRYLAGVQLPDGGLPMTPGGESNLLATAQALPALAGDSFLSLDPAVVGPAIVVQPEPTPTATPTETPTSTPTTTSATVTPTPTTTETLPPTGGSGSNLSLVAVGLLVLGGVLLAASRRVLTRP